MWIKRGCKRKQSDFPYVSQKKDKKTSGGMRQMQSSSTATNKKKKTGAAARVPPWWCPGVAHIEPAHMLKVDLIKVMIYILYRQYEPADPKETLDLNDICEATYMNALATNIERSNYDDKEAFKIASYKADRSLKITCEVIYVARAIKKYRLQTGERLLRVSEPRSRYNKKKSTKKVTLNINTGNLILNSVSTTLEPTTFIDDNDNKIIASNKSDAPDIFQLQPMESNAASSSQTGIDERIATAESMTISELQDQHIISEACYSGKESLENDSDDDAHYQVPEITGPIFDSGSSSNAPPIYHQFLTINTNHEPPYPIYESPASVPSLFPRILFRRAMNHSTDTDLTAVDHIPRQHEHENILTDNSPSVSENGESEFDPGDHGFSDDVSMGGSTRPGSSHVDGQDDAEFQSLYRQLINDDGE